MTPVQILRAKEVCRTCPVRRVCLGYALVAKEAWGIWGGLTRFERSRCIDDDHDIDDVMREYDDGTLEERVVLRV